MGEVPGLATVHPVQLDRLHRPQSFENKGVFKSKRRGAKAKSTAVGGGVRAVTQEEFDGIMRDIAGMWELLKGASADAARRAFMEIVDEWPFSQHSVSRQVLCDLLPYMVYDRSCSSLFSQVSQSISHRTSPSKLSCDVYLHYANS